MKIVRTILKHTKGNVAVEFSLILPILLIIFTGLYELTSFILINNKLIRASSTIGFVVAQQDLSRNTLISYMDQARNIMLPFPYESIGGMVVSHVKVNQNNTMTINWQQSTGTGSSRIGTVGSAPINLPNNITITGTERLIVSEAFYKFTPLLLNFFLPEQQLYEVTIQVPRTSQMDILS